MVLYQVNVTQSARREPLPSSKYPTLNVLISLPPSNPSSALTGNSTGSIQSVYARQWQSIIEGSGENIELVPVEERALTLTPNPIDQADSKFSELHTCFVRTSTLRNSTLGAVEICQVAKFDLEDGFIRMVQPTQLVVVKVFEFDRVTHQQENPLHEMVIHQKLSKFNNPNIMPLLGCMVTSSKLFAVYPYFNDGDLFQNLSSSPGILPEQNIRALMRSMLSALLTCHDDLVCHRDVSLENFLVSANGTGLVLIDFGLSVEMDAHFTIHNYGPVGKTKYMAPELVLGRPSAVDGRKVDVWSLGIVLFMLITKAEPFHVALNVDARYKTLIVKKGMRDVFTAWGYSVSPSLMNLLESMLNPEPTLRPTVQEILSHPWMAAEA